MADIFKKIFKEYKNCCKEYENANIENRSLLYYKLVEHVLRLSISVSYDGLRNCDKHIILGFVYEKT